MIRINKNQLKRLYAFVKDNIVTIIVVIAIVLGLISIIHIITDSKVQSIDGDLTYEDVTNQRFGISNIHTLNPIVSNDRDTYYIDQLIYSSLFVHDNDMGIQPDLVKSYTTEPDRGIAHLTLRSGVKFHKGQALSARDVVYTYNYIKSAGKSGLYYDNAQKIESISASGNNKLTVVFKDVNDASLDYLIFPILNEGDSVAEDGFRPNGTGQYAISKIRESKEIKLKPNTSYYGEEADNHLTFEVFPKTTVLKNLVSSYEITALMYQEFDIDELQNTSDITRVMVPSNKMEYIGFNFNNKSLAINGLRKAIAYALDLDNIAKNAYGSTALINDSIYFPNYLGVKNKGDIYASNFNKAIKLLKKSNLIDRNQDGYIDNIDGDRITINILVNKNDSNRILVANYLSESLSELQIDNEIHAYAWDQYKEKVKSGDFDILVGGYTINSNDKLRFMFDKGNYINYENEEVMELVNDLCRCHTNDELIEIYTKLKKLINNELPYYCVCYKQYSLLGSSNMDFEELPNFENIYHGVNTWEFQKLIREE